MRREIRPGPALVRDCDLQFGSDQIGIWMVAPQASPSACCVHGQGNISPIFRWHQKKKSSPAAACDSAGNADRSLMIAQFWFVRLPLFISISFSFSVSHHFGRFSGERCLSTRILCIPRLLAQVNTTN